MFKQIFRFIVDICAVSKDSAFGRKISNHSFEFFSIGLSSRNNTKTNVNAAAADEQLNFHSRNINFFYFLRYYSFCILYFLFLFPSVTGFLLAQNIVINEVCSANDSVISDGDRDYEDWLELYNPTGTAINLENYSLTYKEDAMDVVKWTFPKVFIPAYSHLGIWCSEKDRMEVIDHLEVAAVAFLPWRYTVNYSSSSEPDTNWRYPFFNDAGWLQGPGGIGYGDGDDSTVIDTTIFGPPISLYMRQTFVVPDTSKFIAGFVLLDFDDGYAAYLNGVEIARENVGFYGTPSAYNEFAYEDHEATLYQNGEYSGFNFIDKQTLGSALVPGNNVFCIQTHNVSPTSSDMSSHPFFILGVNDTSTTFWPLPADPMQLHTNFTLSSKGFYITLSNPGGNIVDTRFIGPMQTNHSRGRTPDGGNTWCIFDLPTPNDTNSISPCYTDYASKPTFTLAAGFYNGIQSTSVTSSQTGTLRFTTEGSIPTQASQLYSTLININSTQVIRARNFSSNPQILPSEVATNTYFINENVTLPVVSISTNPENLWDWNTGIYVYGPGQGADTTPADFPFLEANFWKGWEKQAHTEYFDKQKNQCFELDNGLKIHGNWSKGFPQRSFRILANDDYATPWINYKLFPEKNITKFKAFNIRNAGIDWNTAHMRDGVMNRSVRKTNIDIMDHESCVLFLNGQYWGVYEIRERQDKYYIQQNYSIDPGKMDLLRYDGDIMEGSNEGFLDMVDYISNTDMSMQTNYDSVKKMLDIPNFCDYFTTEVYYNNSDWLGNNIKFWRPNNPVGKWRYILWDTDGGLGLFGPVTEDLLPAVTNSDTATSFYGNPHSFMVEGLLANTEFKNYFINRYADLMNTVLHPVNLSKLTYKIRDNMSPEMTRHFAMWGNAGAALGWGLATTEPEWQERIDTMINFINIRPGYARDYVRQEFSLIKNVDVTLDVSPAGAGTIKISTIIPDSLPWTGVYFDGNPVGMTATANPGYKFLYWKSPNLIPLPNTSSYINLNITQNEPFTAYFVPIEYTFNAYPNPFTNSFAIQFLLPKDQQVSVKLFNIMGQRVASIVSESVAQTWGEHTVTFDADKQGLSSGIYFVEFRTEDFTKTIKLVKTNKE